ncbi:MAG: ATP-binding protein [Clostridiales bacterium]|nr:ATP-binding protein [Clostridiales bacterium]MDY3746030.1 ATP-binding protein [Lachnospiraceae bacterium]
MILVIVLITAIIVYLIVRDARRTKGYLAQEKALTKNLENTLMEAQRANQAKTIFLNNMSHDIRTPMNAIIGFTNIAMKQNSNINVGKCLEKIASSSEHLLALINDVLDISRIESGKVVYTPVPTNLCAVTEAVLTITQGFLTGRHLTFRVERPQQAQHCGVLADPSHIREILVNILSNAVKFTEDGGTIVFSMDRRPGTDENHIIVCFTVTDTGCGMSEEFLTHIFDEFSQEESGARTQYKGTGLGMAITKRYVDLMGGTIGVKSSKGEGTTVTVELPLELTDGDDVQKQDLCAVQTDLNGVRILMAEDNDLNAEIATIQLEEYGMQITRVADGKEAVEIFAGQPADTFDVILMDIMMPKMNGYEATKVIRTMDDRPDGRIIPVIAMTANAFAEDVQASIDAGMDAHLSKPMDMDEVVKTVARVLRRGKSHKGLG